MSILDLIVYLVIAGICGAIARAVAGGTTRGFVLSVLVGFLGAYLGTWLAHEFHLPVLFAMDIGGHSFPVAWALLGGIVLVALAHFLMRRPSYGGRWQARF
jgi:uncharacterized membrane protein YeaQ/YmgE (transglycosylase-associated protein family)